MNMKLIGLTAVLFASINNLQGSNDEGKFKFATFDVDGDGEVSLEDIEDLEEGTAAGCAIFNRHFTDQADVEAMIEILLELIEDNDDDSFDEQFFNALGENSLYDRYVRKYNAEVSEREAVERQLRRDERRRRKADRQARRERRRARRAAQAGETSNPHLPGQS